MMREPEKQEKEKEEESKAWVGQSRMVLKFRLKLEIQTNNEDILADFMDLSDAMDDVEGFLRNRET